MNNLIEIIDYYDFVKNQIDLRFQEYMDLYPGISQTERMYTQSLGELFNQRVYDILRLNVAQLREENCYFHQLRHDCYFVQATSVPFEGIGALLVLTDWFLDANEKRFFE